MSGAGDGGVGRSVARGRETLGAMLSAAQTHLQKVFIVFLVGFIGTIYGLWAFGWDILKHDLIGGTGASVNAITPFDVILLQVKVGLVVGIILATPVLVYLSKDALVERGYWPHINARWKVALVALLAVGLLGLGIGYGYFIFFPIMFNFLAGNAISVGLQPHYSFVKWAQFVFLLMISFGGAAQLPLAMTGLALSGVVPYETFRDKWKYAVVATFIFGALFSPPDPFTQVMWAVPILALYIFSLGLTKFLVTLRRGSAEIDIWGTLRRRWLRIFGIPVVVASAVAAAIAAGVGGYLNQVVIPAIPYFTPSEPVFKYIGPMLGLPRNLAIAVVALAVAVVLVIVLTVYYVYRSVADAAIQTGRLGDPTAIDLATLDAGGVRAAPPEVFAEMSEQEALVRAQTAIDANQPEKAQAILDRFEEPVGNLDELDAGGVRAAPPEVFTGLSEDEALSHAQTAIDANQPEKAQAILDRFEEPEAQTTVGDASGAPPADAVAELEGGPANTGEGSGAGSSSEESGLVTRTTAGVVDAFTAEETTEEDIGGYYYDITFVLDSLRSRAFLLVGLFSVVLAATFIWLEKGGLGVFRHDFLVRLPAGIQPEDINVVALHPVEALVFEVKLSTLFAGLAILPFAMYYAWPALKERGFASGDRRMILVWAAALVIGLGGGTALGYTIIAPRLISWLATDAINSDMLINYRISSAGWLVFFTTAGVGILGMIPVTMALFHRGGLVSYDLLFGRWREVTVGVFSLTALLSPRGTFMMFILGIPIMLAYGLGLGIIWIYTLGGRRTTERSRQSAD